VTVTELLPESSRYLTTVLEGVRSIAWDRWFWAAAPFAAALVQPVAQKCFPQWGDGEPLLTVTATRGATVGQHLWSKALPLTGPVVIGVMLLSQSVILPCLILLVLAFVGAVHLSLDRRRARTQVTFYRHRFRVLGIAYRYDDIAMVVEGGPEDPPGTKVLKWRELEVSLTKTQYQTLCPCLQQKKPVNAPTTVCT